MTPERYAEVRKLFEAALARNLDERTAWLEAECPRDPQLRGQVQRLLIADSLDCKVIDQTAETLLAQYEGRRFGAYEILQQIGTGGMGSVYLARRADEAFQRRVAVKVLRPGPTSLEMTTRFHQERRILARLDHSNVARLLDGGSTDDGLPYLVMEFVEGKPIDEYCDEHKLNVVDRLVLFRTVCAAVSYSHRNLVVHRDLKPRNILITSDGTVKLLDFGIAKLLGEEPGCVTRTGLHPMTPEYASPEQVLGHVITTASDVYSLGVILYKLLTGRSPYGPNRWPLHEVARQICDDIPLRPSDVVLGTSGDPDQQAGIVQQEKPERLKKRLAGDVDNIVLTALRKEPLRRYASVDAFSEDLRRHLSGLPVQARKDTLRYRTGKFVIRHPAGVVAGAVIVLMMILAVAGTSWQARVAREERARAQEQAQQAEVQRELAQLKSAEADLHRQRAEAAAELAREQLRIAQQRTAEAQMHKREAERQRAQAGILADSARIITAELLQAGNISDMGPDLTAAANTFSNILSQHNSQNAWVRDLQDLVGRQRDRSARIIPKTPSEWRFFSANPAQFDHGIDQNVSFRGSASAYLKSKRAGIEGSATLSQQMSADAYRRKRVRVSAVLKSRVIEESADLFVSARDDEDYIAWRTLEHPLRGTNDWARYSVVVDVPEECEGIAIGVTLKGGGILWVDDFSIEVVDRSIPVTNNLPRGPLNLDFEGPNQ